MTSFHCSAGLKALTVLLAALAGYGLATAAPARATATTQTVCTITVNSSDEREAFRRHLPASKYRFVELVEPGRPDWLASACRAGVRCNVLVISGHFDGDNEFFSDQLASAEHLPVDELERASCSGSCPSLFSDLKEVHLFGCNTLNPTPLSSATAEVVRSLVREGHSVQQAQRQLLALNAQHGESSRDRMRLVFKDVPVMYGFSSVAPLGPIAAATLEIYFRARGAREIGQGRVSAQLLGRFAPYAMTVAQGMTDQDPHAPMRHDVCQFVDDRIPDAQRLAFVHQILQRDVAQARVHLDRIQRVAARFARQPPPTQVVRLAMNRIADDGEARQRFLAFARDADQPLVRARMLKVARDLGWLSPQERWDELAHMLLNVLAQGPVGQDEVDLACTLNREGDLDGMFDPAAASKHPTESMAHAAVRACLGDPEGRARVLQGLVSTEVADVQMARSYLRQRPVTDAVELQRMAAAITQMPATDAQVRALETLGRHYIADRQILDQLIQLYARTPSWAVQAAVAGILLRADHRAMAAVPLERTLRAQRRPAPAGDNMIDALIRRLRAS